MATDLIDKKGRKCVLCKYWNGAVGSTTIQPKNNGNTFALTTVKNRLVLKDV